MGQPRRAQLHLPAPDRAARRGLGRRSPSITCSRPSRARATVAHVCDDIACRLQGAEATVRGLEQRCARTASRPRRRRRRWHAQPVPRPVRARAGGARSSAPAARPSAAADRPRRSSARRRDRACGARTARPHRGGPCAAVRAAGRSARAASSCAASAWSIRPAWTPIARTAAIAALAARVELGPDGVIAEVDRVEAARPRRRGVSDRPQVGGGGRANRRGRITSSATPTSRSRARSRTAC